MKRTEKILLAIFLFAIPFQSRLILYSSHPFNEWASIFLWGTDLLVAALVMTNYELLITNEKKNIVIFAFLAIALISIHNAIIPAIAWYRWIKLAEYIYIFLYFRNKAHDVLSLSHVVVASAAFQAGIGIFQYLVQHSLGLKILGESVLSSDMSGVAVVVANGEKFLRAYGTFPHPNLLALWLVFGIWAFWYISNIKSQTSKIWYFFYALILGALVLTFSRTAIALWALSSLFLIRRQHIRLVVLTVSIVTIASIIVLPQVLSRARISSDDEAVAQRLFYNEQAIAGAREHLVIGNGIGQFVPVLMRDLHHYTRSIYQPAHNVYLLVLNETGIAGLLVFLIFLTTTAWRIRGQPFPIAIFFTLCLIAFFDHYPWTLQQGGLMFWGMFGIIQGSHGY